MSKSNPPLWRSNSSAISHYVIAALSVVVALVTAEVLTAWLHTEPIATSLLCAIMFVAWFGGFGPGMLAIVLAILAFHYYLAHPLNSFAVQRSLLSREIAELPRLVLFSITALLVNFLMAARTRSAESLRRSNDQLRAAIEEQKRIGQALQHSEMYLAEAQRLSHTGSFGRKIGGGEIFWSKETYRIKELDETVKPTIGLILQRVHPDDRQLVQQQLDRAAGRGEQEYDYEYRLLMPDGTIKHIHVRAHHQVDDGGEEEVVGALMDVTAARQAQDALQTAQAELAHATRVTTLGQMSASIVHEINQPLAAIVTNAEASVRWMSRPVPDIEEALTSVARILKNAHRLSEVIRRVRQYSKKANPEMIQLDINEIAEEAITLVRHEALRHGVTLRFDFASTLLPVRGDRIQLQQVIVNLVVNGTQAMTTVDDRDRVLTLRTEQQSDRVLLAVQDVGIGIEAENAQRLFEAFYTTKPDGLGIGLSICKSIVEAHGGRLSASGNAGPGMTFQFTVPVYKQAA